MTTARGEKKLLGVEEAVAGGDAVEAGGGLGSRTAAVLLLKRRRERFLLSFFGGSPYSFLFLVILGSLSLFSVFSLLLFFPLSR